MGTKKEAQPATMVRRRRLQDEAWILESLKCASKKLTAKCNLSSWVGSQNWKKRTYMEKLVKSKNS